MSTTQMPDWDKLVEPIVRARQEEAAHKAAQDERLQLEQKARELATATEAQLGRETARTERWALLERFKPKGLLEALNGANSTWRKTGTITQQESTEYPYSSAQWAQYSLSLAFDKLEASGGGGGEWPEPYSYVIHHDYQTFVAIGIARTNKDDVIPIGNDLRRWKATDYFSGGYGLYIIDSHVSLHPVPSADTFTRVVPNLDWRGMGAVIIDVDLDDAQEILLELLTRSCIQRAMTNSLPWQLQDSAAKELADHNRARYVGPQRKKSGSFWGRLLGLGS